MAQEKNVGGYDRVSRWIIGSGLVAYGLASDGWRRWAALALGGNLLWTAGSQRCAVNRMLGVNTAEEGESQEQESIQEQDAAIDEASKESFPASDAPAFATTR